MAILRRQRATFWEYLREAPRDWFLSLAEDYELIDWNKISEATSWPCALALNALFVLVSAARQFSARGSDLDAIVDADRRYRGDKIGHSGDWNDTNGSRYGTDQESIWTSFLLFLQSLLLLVSIGNAWLLYSARRTYQLRPKDSTSIPSTPNCRRVALGTRRPQWARSLWGRLVWMLWKWVARVDDQIQGEVWELSLWTPSTFSRNLFCWYSPVQLLVMSFMDGSNWYYILPLAAAVAVQCSFVVREYSVLVKDKQILFGEVYNEYNDKFVHPRVFPSTRDVGTSTMEDWSLARKASIMFGIGGHRGPMDRNSRRLSPPIRRHTANVAAREIYPREYLPHDLYTSRGVAPQTKHASGANGYRGARRTPDLAGVEDRDYENDPLNRFTRAPVGTNKIRDRSIRRKYYNDMVEKAKRSM
ncbi:hypothetical protein GGI25_002205 [Coemansia spiralis]|uniref:Nuclear rim protein 1 n=2 Tax=Coemansia TaxID=4863 RepID=A0A9W8G9G5_9FUNG|nr:hypothetical protein EDC05_000105 [Coemansia umbellata]KAJ2626029.1 hypothetical protein GGI26_000113 [Coemansia sp. RSA 1358]KAJ2678617.1 hypothetical protein GGI25_002205 [Coemansia spiralis]